MVPGMNQSPTDILLQQLAAMGTPAQEMGWSQPALAPLSVLQGNAGNKPVMKPEIPSAISDLVRALMLPGETLAGKYEGMDTGAQSAAMLQDALGASLDMGMPVAAGAAGKAATSGVDPSALNIFAGMKAKNADRLKLLGALGLEADSRPPEEIFDATGWFLGADDKPRFEIDDIMELDKWVPGNSPNRAFNNWSIGTVEDFIDHPKLFEAYPELRGLGADLKLTPGEPQRGQFNKDLNMLTASGSSPEDIGSVMLHELQHAVQLKEEFAGGGNPEWTQHIIASNFPEVGQQLQLPRPYDIYNNLMGEVEARNVQRRYELGPLHGMKFEGLPTLTQSVPSRKQIDPKNLAALSNDPAGLLILLQGLM